VLFIVFGSSNRSVSLIVTDGVLSAVRTVPLRVMYINGGQVAVTAD
jgi:hypothetical protein